MKKAVVIFLSIVTLLLISTSCTHPAYQFLIKGVNIYPTPVAVNKECVIYLRYSEVPKPDYPKREFHWEIEGYSEEFVTDKTFLPHLKFDTPGIKKGYVYTISEDEEILVNDLEFEIEVIEATTTQLP